MSHVYHEELPGYSAEQILHDGCPECEHRGKHPFDAVAHLDTTSFRRLLVRSGMFDNGKLDDVADCEVELLKITGIIVRKTAALA